MKYLIFILIAIVLLTGCSQVFVQEEHERKLDAKIHRVEFPEEAPDLEHVEKQKIRELSVSNKLAGGMKEFKALDIVKAVKVTGEKIEVEFMVKKRDSKEKEDFTLREIVYDNTLFLIYTIVDTFPEIKKIRLYANYYYQDQFGNPYPEIVFVANIKREVANKLNRDYFRPEMLPHVIDEYIADSIKNNGE